MKKYFNNIWKYVAGGGTVLAYQAWYDRIKNSEKSQQILDEIIKTRNAIDSNNNSSEKIKLLKSRLDELHNLYLNCKTDMDKITSEEKSKSVFDKFKSEICRRRKSI